MTGSTNASIHFVHLHPRMMWHLSRPAWARYPRLLPKATSLNKISTKVALNLTEHCWGNSLWIKPELLQAHRAPSPKQEAQTGMTYLLLWEKRGWPPGVRCWPLKWEVLKFRVILTVPRSSPWSSRDAAFHVDGKFLFWKTELFSLNIGEKLHRLLYATCLHMITRCGKTQKFFPGDGCWYKRRD